MSGRTPSGGEAMDLEVLARDDALLDALGRGEPAPAGDELAELFAAWHADVVDGAPAEIRPAAPTAEPAEPTSPPARPARTRRPRPWTVRLAAAAVALLALGSGLGIGSRNAAPDSPLWSLTKLLYPQQAEVRDIEDSIDRARAALADGRFDEAQQLVDRARGDLEKITDAATVARLRAGLDALTRELTAARAEVRPTAVPTSPAPGGRPTTPAARPGTGASAPQPQPSRPPTSTSTSPGGSASDTGKPLLPLPKLPLPPSPSLSPLLPGLPLPTLLD
ncbi:anti-sigma-D factor RsdA [Micromonospora sp. DR5-3]|uniref:anti-sigma-D factor RsdA n=1 Tax=unclassified Micromonospora TaxID=2617518 RepID=UPI0011DBE8CF|nr:MULTISPECIES: anti-sigma-D factor RsdA [unclassified Micromonospora]MCW3813961.1 anti-sigma-D factor RsdA [Micromonospora sp. DR5-3]TYC24502.1 hypothetical protein FXF52_09525 [Micromonospora sp. MP36]